MYETPEAAFDRIRFIPAGRVAAQTPSGYLTPAGKPVFRRGATLFPHVLTIAERTEVATNATRIRATTQKSTKPPWTNVRPRTIEIPKHWVIELCTNSMVAFVTRTIKAIIPLDAGGNLLRKNYIDEDDWWLLDEQYRSHAGAGKRTPRTLLEQIDHLQKLSVQLPLRPETQRKLVLYPKSGDIMRAARHEAGHAVVADSLYWYRARTSSEAAYLTVLLNANCLQQAYADTQESGRDFHLHPWRKMPIPRYDETKTLHKEIAALCTDAEKIAERTVNEQLKATPGKRQVSLSKAVRKALAGAGIDAAIDECARQLLPDHVG